MYIPGSCKTKMQKKKEVRIITSTGFWLLWIHHRSSTWINVVIEVFPLVQPNFRETSIVVVDYLAGTTGEGVRGRLTKHMPDMRARRYFQRATTHPYLTNSNRVSMLASIGERNVSIKLKH